MLGTLLSPICIGRPSTLESAANAKFGCKIGNPDNVGKPWAATSDCKHERVDSSNDSPGGVIVPIAEIWFI